MILDFLQEKNLSHICRTSCVPAKAPEHHMPECWHIVSLNASQAAFGEGAERPRLR